MSVCWQYFLDKRVDVTYFLHWVCRTCKQVSVVILKPTAAFHLQEEPWNRTETRSACELPSRDFNGPTEWSHHNKSPEQDRGYKTPSHRPQPVNPVVGPIVGKHSWAECPCRVQTGSRLRPVEQSHTFEALQWLNRANLKQNETYCVNVQSLEKCWVNTEIQIPVKTSVRTFKTCFV